MKKEQQIHATAIVSPEAQLAPSVSVGPYAIIGPDVKIGENTKIGPHVVIEGDTEIGRNVQIFQFASVGAPPQDLKYKGEQSTLSVGDNTIIREFATLHKGTQEGGGATVVGKDCLIMAYCHIAHDCRLGKGVIMANCATLGGHVEIDDYAVLGGLCAVKQFIKIGKYAFLGGMSSADKDVPPYVKFWGQRGKVYGLNLIGLKRHGFSQETIRMLKKALRFTYGSKKTLKHTMNDLEAQMGEVEEIRTFIEFVRNSTNGIAGSA